MARPYKRVDGRWEVRYKDLHGKWRSVYGRTKTECSEKLRQRLNERDAGKLPAHSTLTLKQFLDQWLEDVVRPNRTSTTYSTYRFAAFQLIAAIGEVKLRELRTHQIQHAYTQMRQTLSPATISITHTMLHGALEVAMNWDMINANPSLRVTPPRRTPPSVNPLTYEEAQALLDASRGTHYHLVWLTLIQTGIRIGELGGLLWPQIDLPTRTIYITHMLLPASAGTGWELVERTKTPRSKRAIRISADLAARFQEHHTDQLAGRAPSHAEHPYVFTNQRGQPLNRHDAAKRLAKACQLAGIPRRHPHELRHTCATLLFARNTNPKKVQELLGHSSISQTMDTYSHFIPTMHDEVADTMAELFVDTNTVESTVKPDGRTLRALD